MLTRIGLARKIADQRALRRGDDDAEHDRRAGTPASTPTDRLARKTSADADTVAPRQSDMMLPVSVMKVMPTATQPMNEMALSSALMLSGEVKPGVVSANSAMAAPAAMRTPSTRCRARPRDEACAQRKSLMPPRPDG